MENHTPRSPALEVAVTACQRCRRRKIKCDRKNPCSRCRQAGEECDRGPGEKTRPIPKSYTQALENQVAALEILLRRVAEGDEEQRSRLLAEYLADQRSVSTPPQGEATVSASSQVSDDLSRARAQAGQLRRAARGGAAQFYGGTSLFQIPLSNRSTSTDWTVGEGGGGGESQATYSPEFDGDLVGFSGMGYQLFEYGPHDDISRGLLVEFFRHQCQFNMSIHREYFVRDYDSGAGRHCSDVLVYAICAMGAVASKDSLKRPLADVYSQQAQQLLYCSLDSPDITLLQALLVLGQCEIGLGRTSKGWLFCGMAFRLAHEMGLHLDPANWDDTQAATATVTTSPGEAGPSSDVDRELSRRVYWAAFILDKQLSLYFGRPPALYMYESDVRNPVRLPYPPNWNTLLGSYGIDNNNTVEEGILLVESFIHQAELAKILHRMITELFENRRSRSDDAVVISTIQQINVALNKWLMKLPSRLHWNQWTIGRVPSCVLYLHMLFHTSMIILHRPPRRLWTKAGLSTMEDVEICYESLAALQRLIRSYGKHYEFRLLPVDFTYTLSTMAGVILMRRELDGLAWDDSDVARQLGHVLEVMDNIREVWPCIIEVKDGILRARDTQDLPPISQPNFADDINLIPHFFALDTLM